MGIGPLLLSRTRRVARKNQLRWQSIVLADGEQQRSRPAERCMRAGMQRASAAGGLPLDTLQRRRLLAAECDWTQGLGDGANLRPSSRVRPWRTENVRPQSLARNAGQRLDGDDVMRGDARPIADSLRTHSTRLANLGLGALPEHANGLGEARVIYGF